MRENALNVGCNRSYAPLESWPSVCSDEATSHRIGDSISSRTSQVERVEASIDHPGTHVTSRSRLNARYQMATHTHIASMSRTEAAAPKPNRLLEKDCR